MPNRTDIERLVETTGPSGAMAGPLIRTAGLRPLLGVGRTRFYELIWETGFPQPVTLGGGESDLVWFTHEILDWLADRPRVTPPDERRAVAPDEPATDGVTPTTEGTPLRPAGPRRRLPSDDDGSAAVPAGPEDLEFVPARSVRRAS